jgi:hypothetical protein
MMPQSEGWRHRWVAIFLLLLLGGSAGDLPGAAGQFAKRRQKSTADENYGEVTKPQLLNADTEPTLRYPAASFSGRTVFSTSYGWFDVTRNGIRYTPVQPPGKLDEGFEASSPEISEIKLQYSYLRFRTGNKGRTVFYVPQERWGTIHSARGAMQAAATGSPGTASMMRAMKGFSGVLASVKPAPPPAPELTLQAEPATVEKGHALALVWTSMNATSVVLQPGDRSMPTQGALSLTPGESTTYTLIAKGLGGTKTATAVVTVTQPAAAAPPTIMLVEPSAAAGQTLEVTSPTLKIRGVAMDSTGFPIVSINGTPANMKPQNAQAAEFWSDSVTLQPGENKFEIVALNRAQGQAKLAFVARYTPPAAPPAPNPKALGKQDILDLLKGFVTSQRVAALVKERGVKFTPTANDLAEIRAAGGQDDLINALKQAASTANP